MSAATARVRRIADRSLSLWERLALHQDTTEPLTAASEESDARVARWQRVVAGADQDLFLRRLTIDGLTELRVRGVLAHGDAPAPSPPWLDVLVDLLDSTAEYRQHPPGIICRNLERPRPFEDALHPIVFGARRRLHRALGSPQSLWNELPRGCLSDEAYRSLEIGLLDRLAQTCALSLLAEFSSFRPAGHSLLNTLVGATGRGRHHHYDAFITQLLSADLLPFFESYPVLGRLTSTLVEGWVEHCVEFQSALRDDAPAIATAFDLTPGASPGGVVGLRVGLSDPHQRGRSVMRVTFANGLVLAYKPRPVEIDRAFAELVDWCNQQGLSVALDAAATLTCGDHGWVRWIDPRPCADAAKASRFYRRAGMLLALLHVVLGTDCHYENVVAAGEHPVLIDLETVMVPERDRPVSDQAFWDSVVRVGMLPHWEAPQATTPCDISALGGIGPQETPAPVARWKDVNTDDVDVYYEPVALPSQANAAMLDGTALSPADYLGELVDGFREIYRLIVRHRPALLAEGGPLAAFSRQSIRYVFRRTEHYGHMLRHVLTPEYLRNGCDRSIELERVWRGYLNDSDADSWPVIRAERDVLERGDFPRFDAIAAGTSLCCDGEVVVPRFFERSGYDQVAAQLESMSEAGLELQVRLIEASVHAWRARGESHFETSQIVGPSGDRGAFANVAAMQAASAHSCLVFTEAALAIADRIASKAIDNPDGSLSWKGFTHLPQIGRYQLQPVTDGLYGGRTGVALFLAACDRVTGHGRYRETMDRALQPLRETLRDRDATRQFVRRAGLGIAEGVGGILYALSRVAEWREEPSLLDDAEALAGSVAADTIDADGGFDVIGGSAGAILGVLALHRARPLTSILEHASACARHLCSHQLLDGPHTGGWPCTFASRPLAGFSHGASGIAYALARLHAVTGGAHLIDAARKAVEFERAAYVPSVGNWIDYRRESDSPAFMTSWCHGAPGIALARLALAAEMPAVLDELNAALETTARPQPESVDHVCCGGFGRFDILRRASSLLGRPDLDAAAGEQALEALRHAPEFRVHPTDVPQVINPGFFDGLSGIGYVLLRLGAGPLPSVLAFD